MEVVIILAVCVGLAVMLLPGWPSASLTPGERATVAQMHVRREAMQRTRTCSACGARWAGLKFAPGKTPPICDLCDIKRGCDSCRNVVCAYDCAAPRCGECGIVGGVELVPHPDTPHFGKTWRCRQCRPEEDI